MDTDLTIAVLSGKGGTGKTMIAVNLTRAAQQATYIDCDVEEPNGQLFFKPTITSEQSVYVSIPAVNQDLCNGCRTCVQACAFNALAMIGNHLLVFEDVCHSCGLCTAICPNHALTERNRPIGVVRTGNSGATHFIGGEMLIGESSAVPIIKSLLGKKTEGLHVIDAPPGSGCLVSESIAQADFCLLVAEPTIFGTHNLAMVHELVKLMGKPCAVVLNKTQGGNNPSEEYAKANDLVILQSVPYVEELAMISSEGKLAYDERRRYRDLFDTLLSNVMKEANGASNPDSQR